MKFLRLVQWGSVKLPYSVHFYHFKVIFPLNFWRYGVWFFCKHVESGGSSNVESNCCSGNQIEDSKIFQTRFYKHSNFLPSCQICSFSINFGPNVY